MKGYSLEYKDLEEGEVYTAITSTGFEIDKITIRGGLPCDPRNGKYVRLTARELAKAKYKKEKELPLVNENDYNILKMISADYTRIVKERDGIVAVYGPQRVFKNITNIFNGNFASIPNDNKDYSIDELIDFYEG